MDRPGDRGKGGPRVCGPASRDGWRRPHLHCPQIHSCVCLVDPVAARPPQDVRDCILEPGIVLWASLLEPTAIGNQNPASETPRRSIVASMILFRILRPVRLAEGRAGREEGCTIKVRKCVGSVTIIRNSRGLPRPARDSGKLNPAVLSLATIYDNVVQPHPNLS
jgi:hypothetical protein